MEFYPCDPTKHVVCDKDMCYLKGGPCSHTSYKEYALEEDTMSETFFEALEKAKSANPLVTMLNLQESFQRRVDPRCMSDDLKERAAFIRDHYVYLDQELQEMLYEVPFFKHWKDYSKMTDAEIVAAYDKAKEELVDAWHFFMNLMLGLGMSAEELYDGYLLKNKENIRRQNEGYDHTMNHIGIKEES